MKMLPRSSVLFPSPSRVVAKSFLLVSISFIASILVDWKRQLQRASRHSHLVTVRCACKYIAYLNAVLSNAFQTWPAILPWHAMLDALMF